MITITFNLRLFPIVPKDIVSYLLKFSQVSAASKKSSGRLSQLVALRKMTKRYSSHFLIFETWNFVAANRYSELDLLVCRNVLCFRDVLICRIFGFVNNRYVHPEPFICQRIFFSRAEVGKCRRLLKVIKGSTIILLHIITSAEEVMYSSDRVRLSLCLSVSVSVCLYAWKISKTLGY